jgi:hypothetical protein
VSLNYGTLKTAVLDYAHRADLSANVAGFIRLAEGMIRRELRAYEVTYALGESDRSAAGLYNLPSTLLEVRVVNGAAADGSSFTLENVGVVGIKNLDSSSTPVQYAVRGQQIEFRGIPGTGATFDLLYLGWPAELAADPDTNSLLTNHEALYVYGALFHLYQYTQDVELAQGALDTFSDAVEKLNQQNGRKNGGASVGAAYNFGLLSTSTGY